METRNELNKYITPIFYLSGQKNEKKGNAVEEAKGFRSTF